MTNGIGDYLPTRSCRMQRSPAFVILFVYISAILHQKFNHFQIIIDACLKMNECIRQLIFESYGWADAPKACECMCMCDPIAISIDKINKFEILIDVNLRDRTPTTDRLNAFSSHTADSDFIK